MLNARDDAERTLRASTPKMQFLQTLNACLFQNRLTAPAFAFTFSSLSLTNSTVNLLSYPSLRQ